MLKPGDVANFETLLKACANKDLALMECKDEKTGEYVTVICAAQRGKNGTVEFAPLAKLFTENPYEEVLPL